jgi:site-specific recombinase XerD
MILVAFWHGLRASEVVQLTGENFTESHLTVGRLKGSLRTTQPLVSHAEPLLDEQKALSEYAAKFTQNQRLFPVTRQHFWRLFQRYSKQAGIPKHKRHPHLLKHSIAMQTIEKAGIEHVRQYLGHKTIASTGAYLKVSDEAASEKVQGSIRSEAD